MRLSILNAIKDSALSNYDNSAIRPIESSSRGAIVAAMGHILKILSMTLIWQEVTDIFVKEIQDRRINNIASLELSKEYWMVETSLIEDISNDASKYPIHIHLKDADYARKHSFLGNLTIKFTAFGEQWVLVNINGNEKIASIKISEDKKLVNLEFGGKKYSLIPLLEKQPILDKLPIKSKLANEAIQRIMEILLTAQIGIQD